MNADSIFMIRNKITGLYSMGDLSWGSFHSSKIWRGRGHVCQFFQRHERMLRACSSDPQKFEDYLNRLDFTNLEILEFSVAVPRHITPATQFSTGRADKPFRPFQFLCSATLRTETK
jgi:hypothetical protein